MSTLASVVLKGLYSAIPAASIPGRIYYATDTATIWRDNGTSWDNVTPAGGAGVGAVGFGDDNGTSVVAAGASKKTIQVPYAGTIIGWSITTDQAGSISVDVWKIASSAPPSAPAIPTSANKISASAPAAISSAQSASGGSSSVSTWTTAVAEWDVFGVDVTSAATITSYDLVILIQKS